MLLLVCGLPGTGKSTIARRLSKKYLAPILRTDEIRKEIIERPTYTEEEKRLVYKVTFLVAKYLLESGRNVILDGTFYKRALRHQVYDLARRTRARLEIIECTAPNYVIKRRMERRRRRKYELSDADYDVYLKIKSQFEPIEREHLSVDTSRPMVECLKDILKYLEKVRSKSRTV
jgi:hypothetical protein